MKIERKCDNCGKTYNAETRDLKRGWGKCCSKKCAASLREKSKSNYNPERVKYNNIRRELWVENGKDIWARKHGFPNFEAYENDYDDTDSMSVELEICPICGLRSDYCTCGIDVVD